MKAIIYSTSTSKNSQAAEKYFKDKNIECTQKFIELDDAAKLEMLRHSGGYLGVPFIAIDKGSGETIYIVGFDKSQIDKALA